MIPSDDALSTFFEWCITQSETLYWSKTISLELLVMQFVRSLREGNFQLYVETLGKLAPWFFAMNCTHYSRCLAVHIRDMVQPKDIHPSVYQCEMHVSTRTQLN
jgi:hypothetical protein